MSTFRLPDREPNGLIVLDTFCCAGGMGMGYYLAGFTVVGVDLHPQPHYPFPFIQADAIEFIRRHGHEYDFNHGSPPCQLYTPLNAYNHKTYPDLIAPTRDALLEAGQPFAIENVEAAAPQLKNPTLLCGPMFDLGMYRHRLLETSFPVTVPEHPKHVARCTRNGYLPTPAAPFMSIHGGRHSRAWQNAACDAMGMPWIKVPAGGDIPLGVREVCEAIPPAYAQWIGRQAAAHIHAARQPRQLELDLNPPRLTPDHTPPARNVQVGRLKGTAAMPITLHDQPSYALDCDRCDTPAEHDDGTPVLFDTEDTARSWARDNGWQVATATGDQFLCSDCGIDAANEREHAEEIAAAVQYAIGTDGSDA